MITFLQPKERWVCEDESILIRARAEVRSGFMNLVCDSPIALYLLFRRLCFQKL